MKCPHCEEETYSGFNIFRSSESIFICKKCNKKSFFPSEKKFQVNPHLSALAMFFMIGGIIIPSPEIKFSLIGIALILAFFSSSGKKVFPFKDEEELKRLKELLYGKGEKIDIRLLDYPNTIDWYDNVKNNSDYANKLGLLYQEEIKDYEEAKKWYKKAIKKNNYDAVENLSKLYFHFFNEKVKGTAYLLSIIGIKYTKDDTLKILQNKFNISMETIKEGYELQLKMPNLQRRYKEELITRVTTPLNKEDKNKNLPKYDTSSEEFKNNIRLIIFVITIILIFLIYNLFSNNYDKRLDSFPYAKKLHETADNFHSSYRLGLFYLEKLKDKEKSLFWLKKSSEDGSLEATVKLIEVDKSKNIWADKAFELGLNPMKLIEIDNKNATKWLHKAAQIGDCKAMKIIAKKIDKEYRYNLDNTFDGIVLANKERNFKKAIDWYTLSYENGCKEVALDIALLYRVNTTSHMRTTPEYLGDTSSYVGELFNNIKSSNNNNYKKAEEWLIKGSKNGDPKLSSYLADIYRFEVKDFFKAIDYYKKAYSQGEKKAFKNILDIYKTLNNDTMIMYLYLEGLKNNDKYIIKELIKYFYKNKEYVNLSLLINEIEDKDSFLTKNSISLKKSIIKEGKDLYTKINGKTLNYLFKKNTELYFDPKSYNNLSLSTNKFFTDPSISYELGELHSNILKDYGKAIKYYQIAYAIKQSGISALKIGMINIYLNNIKKGINWLKRSFNIHKETKAAFNLAQVYKFHLKDYQRAIHWYKKANKGGNIISSYEIADIYENIYKSRKNAIIWYEKSAKKGFSKSFYKLKSLKDTEKTNSGYPEELIDKEGNSELILAIFANDLKEIKKLIKKGVNINYINPYNNWTPLLAAIINNNIKAVELLVNAGVYLKRNSLKVADPIWISFINSKLEIGAFLVKSGANINILNSNAQSLLHYFVTRKDYTIVKYLLKNGIDTSIKNKNGHTALDMAKANKYQKIVTLLENFKDMKEEVSSLKKETKPINPLLDKNSPFYDPRLDKNSSFYNQILEKKYNSFKNLYKNNPNEKTDNYGYNDLMIAVDEKDYQKVKELLENGANINHHGLYGRTPLTRAIFNKDIKMFDLLMSYNPELNLITSQLLEEPIFTAFNFGQYEIVKKLIDAGANINIVGPNNNTLLHKCLNENLINIAKKLLAKKINTTIKNNNGYTALELAKKVKKANFIKLLTNT